jgi:hypothetical protein
MQALIEVSDQVLGQEITTPVWEAREQRQGSFCRWLTSLRTVLIGPYGIAVLPFLLESLNNCC